MQTQRLVAASPQTKSINLGCESTGRPLPFTSTTANCYCSPRKLILILPSHRGWKA